MSKHRLYQGMHLEMKGREYIVERRLPDSRLELRDLITNVCTYDTAEGIIDAWGRGQLRFLRNQDFTLVERKNSDLFIDDITALDDHDPRTLVMRRRYGYVKGLIDRNLQSPSPHDIEKAIKEINGEIKDGSPAPGWKTVYYGWLPAYVESGEDVRSLIPNFKKRGNRTAKFCGYRKRDSKYSVKELELAEELVPIIDIVIQEKYLTPQRLTVAAVYEALLVRINEENLTRKGLELPFPSRGAVYKRIRKLDRYEVTKGRYGKRAADRMFRAYVSGINPSRPLERVEIDSTRLNLMVVDEETGMPIGRPTLTVAIDDYTKMILGFYLSFDGEGALPLLQCLQHAILPKDYVGSRYKNDIHGRWDAHGLPELLIVDNGAGQHSKSFEDACLQLGIPIQYCPVKQPWFKGAIERYLLTLDTELWHGLPGTTFSNIFDKGDYDPSKHAIVGFNTLLTVLHKFIIDYYQDRPHRGINDVPARLWRESTELHPPALPPHRDILQVLLGQLETRTIQHYGVELFGLRYNDPSIQLLRRRHKRGFNFKIKYTGRDLGVIHVLDPDNDQFLPAPSIHPQYANGLNYYAHRVIRNYAKRRMDTASDPLKLAQAKEEIREIVARDWKALKKTGPRGRMARLRGVAQPDYREENRGLSVNGVDNSFPLMGSKSSHVSGPSAVESALDRLGPGAERRPNRMGGAQKNQGSKRQESLVLPEIDNDELDFTGWTPATMPR